MNRDIVALVESPAQLLHLLEWTHRTGTARRVTAVVLAPAEPTSAAQLRTMLTFAAEEAIAAQWEDPRTSKAAWLTTLRRVAPMVAAARQLVIGDPFSGLIQTLLFAARPREVVVVDDGTATMEFANQMGARQALRRWDAAGSPLSLARRPLARHAQRFFESERLSVFTVMPVTDLPPSRVHRHRYAWTRRRFGPPNTLGGLDVIGSSLAESGVVRGQAYLSAVGQLVDRWGTAGRYFAHRKEDAAKLEQIAAMGLRVARPDVPVEIELCRGPVARRLACFPSSVGYTLPLVLAGTDTTFDLQPLPEGMYEPGVGLAARRFLERIATDVRGVAEATSRLNPLTATSSGW